VGPTLVALGFRGFLLGNCHGTYNYLQRDYDTPNPPILDHIPTSFWLLYFLSIFL
jgi:hypothetical protein